MKFCIITASPRENGNTNSLLRPFTARLEALHQTYTTFSLHEKNIHPCTACRSCQTDWTRFGCVYQDDMQEVAACILESDLILLATPIYSFYCTPPMKAMLDRLVYGLNIYYGETKGPSLWAGKSLALLTTCGYPVEKGADLWEAGMKRYCRHSRLAYRGMLAAHHLGYDTVFMDAEKETQACAFAEKLAGTQ